MTSSMRSALAAATGRGRGRARSNSLNPVPPSINSQDYLPELAAIAASILYRSPLPSQEGRPVYILNAAAFPDAFEVDYDSLLSYVLVRLPGEDELISGTEYEIVFFAGGTPDNATTEKKQGPATGWYLQAYHVLSRALRKKLQMLYIVHPRTWVRVLINVFGTVVSPKFRRKILHVNSISALALHIPIERLMIPPSAYLHDRKNSPDIFAPYATGKRAFGLRHPLPKNIATGRTRLPRVLRETSTFLLLPGSVKAEGLFRIPPHSTLTSVLKEAYDRGQKWIVWKEHGGAFVQPGIDRHLVEEVRLEDAYGVHLAASLIKTWYRELREPIFPESSYHTLRERYGDGDVKVTPEDLVDFLLPASNASPLSITSREILTRHLLPLLSIVAAHESTNKMNAENLAICFSMCLLCGSNQMEDAKTSSLVKKVLQAAIEMWPHLCIGMGIDENTFWADLKAPRDANEYEDPMEDVQSRPSHAEGQDERNEVGHRITMNDSDSSTPGSPIEEKGPALPPRRSRAASLKKALTPNLHSFDMPHLPKRKPAPHQQPDTPESFPNLEQSSDVGTPPRYSSIFDADGNPTSTADAPKNYATFDGSGRIIPPLVPDNVSQLLKRKPVSRQASVKQDDSPPITDEPLPMDEFTRPTPENTNVLLARMAAQQAANNFAQRNMVDTTHSATSSPEMPTSASAMSATKPSEALPSPSDDHVFRKPSWPASAMPRQQPNIHHLARPIVPVRKSNTIPIITSDGASDTLRAPLVPKPRTPSPGLLKRMASMEGTGGGGGGSEEMVKSNATLGPRPLNLRQSSVDDLRRLYEERANVAATLVQVGRRTSGGAAPGGVSSQ